MQRLTLLEMVQNILSAMNSDEVNSISDTVESHQVAEEIRTTFYDLYGNRDLGSFEGLVNLDSPGNAQTPHILSVPANVSFVKWVKYRDHRANGLTYVDVDYLPPEEFISRVVEQSEPGSFQMVSLTPSSPVKFPVLTNRAPRFYTIFSTEQKLVFDSFDKEFESWLTASNSLAWGVIQKEFVLADDFIPPIDANFFPHFLAEAKSACFITIKEVANSKEEQRARRQLIRTQTRNGKTAEQRRKVFNGHDYARKR